MDKTAVITGAGSGVGRAAAVALSHRGWRLVLVGRGAQALRETSDLCTPTPESASPSRSGPGGSATGTGAAAQSPEPLRVLVLPGDVCDPQFCRDAVAAIVKVFGRIDVLANVAGQAPNLPIEKTTPAVWRQCIDTNLSSVVYLTAAVWPVFQSQNEGFIVNISSMASIDPFPGFAMYAAAKAGVNLFTLVTGREGEQINVKAVALALGAVETQMLRGLFDETVVPRDAAMSPQRVAQVMVECIMGARTFKSGETIQLTK
jgi:NAD(P)-dependent dehydrogenase (short-subunit alcohol dehydrogenase family)